MFTILAGLHIIWNMHPEDDNIIYLTDEIIKNEIKNVDGIEYLSCFPSEIEIIKPEIFYK